MGSTYRLGSFSSSSSRSPRAVENLRKTLQPWKSWACTGISWTLSGYFFSRYFIWWDTADGSTTLTAGLPENFRGFARLARPHLGRRLRKSRAMERALGDRHRDCESSPNRPFLHAPARFQEPSLSRRR